jgi:phosphoenolpyruvate synthase/pyruvate phosphate dikinase
VFLAPHDYEAEADSYEVEVTTADAYWHFIKTNRLEPLIASKFAEFKAAKAKVTEFRFGDP